jgi:hypothetical protein
LLPIVFVLFNQLSIGDSMKLSLLAAAVALSCASAFAQAPPGVVSHPSPKNYPAGARTEGTASMGASGSGMYRDFSDMHPDRNGMIDKKEWDRHHARMWKRMNKNGRVPMSDLNGGPN